MVRVKNSSVWEVDPFVSHSSGIRTRYYYCCCVVVKVVVDMMVARCAET